MIGFITVCVIIAILIILVVEKISQFLLVRLSIVPITEFPPIDEKLLEKFNSFDPELGWEPVPNSSKKKDVGHNNPDDDSVDAVTYSIDSFGSRMCNIDRERSSVRVASYGDSYCFCREVGDQETFQHYLSEELGIHVSNYGVGNYGWIKDYYE